MGWRGEEWVGERKSGVERRSGMEDGEEWADKMIAHGHATENRHTSKKTLANSHDSPTVHEVKRTHNTTLMNVHKRELEFVSHVYTVYVRAASRNGTLGTLQRNDFSLSVYTYTPSALFYKVW